MFRHFPRTPDTQNAVRNEVHSKIYSVTCAPFLTTMEITFTRSASANFGNKPNVPRTYKNRSTNILLILEDSSPCCPEKEKIMIMTASGNNQMRYLLFLLLFIFLSLLIFIIPLRFQVTGGIVILLFSLSSAFYKTQYRNK